MVKIFYQPIVDEIYLLSEKIIETKDKRHFFHETEKPLKMMTQIGSVLVSEIEDWDLMTEYKAAGEFYDIATELSKMEAGVSKTQGE